MKNQQRPWFFFLCLLLTCWALVVTFLLWKKSDLESVSTNPVHSSQAQRIELLRQLEFLKQSLKVLYQYTPESYLQSQRQALDFLDLKLQKKRKASIQRLYQKIERLKITQEMQVVEIERLPEGQFKVWLLIRSREGKKRLKLSVELKIQLKTVPPTMNNLLGYQMTTLTENVRKEPPPRRNLQRFSFQKNTPLVFHFPCAVTALYNSTPQDLEAQLTIHRETNLLLFPKLSTEKPLHIDVHCHQRQFTIHLSPKNSPQILYRSLSMGEGRKKISPKNKMERQLKKSLEEQLGFILDEAK